MSLLGGSEYVWNLSFSGELEVRFSRGSLVFFEGGWFSRLLWAYLVLEV